MPLHKIELNNIETWVFDLDNTLYPASCNLFEQVSLRMGQFISDYLSVSIKEARVIQKNYFKRYGTTLRGLMVEHSMDPVPFLDYVHKIDLSPIKIDNRLDSGLCRLPGRKLIFTNGTVWHATRIIKHLGIAHHFDGIFDIVDSEYVPKPNRDPYYKIISRYNINPEHAAMIEDIADNLEPAFSLGMTTIWLDGRQTGPSENTEKVYIDHTINDLIEWLDNWAM